jgi:hypothetical protein
LLLLRRGSVHLLVLLLHHCTHEGLRIVLLVAEIRTRGRRRHHVVIHHRVRRRRTRRARKTRLTHGRTGRRRGRGQSCSSHYVHRRRRQTWAATLHRRRRGRRRHVAHARRGRRRGRLHSHLLVILGQLLFID